VSAYISHSSIISHSGKAWFVNAKKSGIYTGMMKEILEQIEAMLTYHNKVFLLRFDLRQAEYLERSQHVSKFFEKLSKRMKSKYGLKRVGYFWVRELEKAKHQHYHCFILLDGNKVQSPYYITEIARQYWEVHFDGSLSWPSNRSYYQLTRGNHDLLQEAIYHVSYLAKGRGKGYKPAQSKNFGRSRIRPFER